MALQCLDASLAVAWLVPGQRTEAAQQVFATYLQGQDEFVGPPLLYPETVSALRRLEAQGLLVADQALRLVDRFLALDIATPSPKGLYSRAYELAVQFRQRAVYDMCYVALAELLSCDLLTLDLRLYNAVHAACPWVKLVG